MFAVVLDCVLCNLSTAAFLAEWKRACAGYIEPAERKAAAKGHPGRRKAWGTGYGCTATFYIEFFKNGLQIPCFSVK